MDNQLVLLLLLVKSDFSCSARMDRSSGKVWASVVREAADSDSRSHPAPLPKIVLQSPSVLAASLSKGLSCTSPGNFGEQPLYSFLSVQGFSSGGKL